MIDSVKPCAEERWISFLLTVKQFQWSDMAYKLTDEDCPICCY